MKRDATWRLKRTGLAGPFWQNRFYDHVIRDEEDLGRHLDYVHFNPVKHGCASRAAEYRWSSFPEWVKKETYPDTWGSMEPDRIRDLDLE
jgi:REP-associated tyrosine transposase